METDRLLSEVLELADDLVNARLTPEEVGQRREQLKTTAFTGEHTLRLVDAPKMDAPGLVRAVCSCGDYSSSRDTPRGATRAWVEHYLAKTRGIGR